MTHHIRVGVLRGGPSNEYEVSLNTGANVLSAIRTHLSDTHRVHDIFIDRDGNWHLEGVQMSPEQILPRIDVAFLALHGAYGEDGKVQHFLEAHGMPFTGSGSLASAVSMNKILTKKVFQNHGIKTPAWKEFSSDRAKSDAQGIVRDLFESLLMPVVVKPVTSGSSVGITLVKSFKDLPAALEEAAKHSDMVMIEEFIPGIEATCGVIEHFRGQELYALPPVEIRPHSEFFDYSAKYEGRSREIVPSTFPTAIKHKLEDLSKSIHRALGLRHYSRSDFIVHPRRGIYALEVNTLPGLTNSSLLPQALNAVGGDLHHLVEHLIKLAKGIHLFT